MNLNENISRLKELMGFIVEQQSPSPELKAKVNQLTVSEGNKVKEYYQRHFSKPETISKFRSKNNLEEIKKFIPTIKYKIFSDKSGKKGFVKKNEPQIIYLNLNALYRIVKNDVSLNGDWLYDTILHEMGHLLDFKMQELGEKTIDSPSGYYNTTNNQDDYVQSEAETFARIQRLRQELELNPNADGDEIKRKLVELLRSKRIKFPNVKISNKNSPTGLIFTPIEINKGRLSELWRFYSPMTIDGSPNPDIAALFGKFSAYQNDGSIFLNLEDIGKVNVSTKAAPNLPPKT